MQLEGNFCNSKSFVLHPDTMFTSSIIISKSRSIHLITLRKKQLWLGNVHGDNSTSSATGTLGYKEMIMVLPSRCTLWWMLPKKSPSSPHHTTWRKSESELRRKKGASTGSIAKKLHSLFSAGVRWDKKLLQWLGIYLGLECLCLLIGCSVYEVIHVERTKCLNANSSYFHPNFKSSELLLSSFLL